VTSVLVGLCNAVCSRQDATQFVGRAASKVPPPRMSQWDEELCGWRSYLLQQRAYVD